MYPRAKMIRPSRTTRANECNDERWKQCLGIISRNWDTVGNSVLSMTASGGRPILFFAPSSSFCAACFHVGVPVLLAPFLLVVRRRRAVFISILIPKKRVHCVSKAGYPVDIFASFYTESPHSHKAYLALWSWWLCCTWVCERATVNTRAVILHACWLIAADPRLKWKRLR